MRDTCFSVRTCVCERHPPISAAHTAQNRHHTDTPSCTCSVPVSPVPVEVLLSPPSARCFCSEEHTRSTTHSTADFTRCSHHNASHETTQRKEAKTENCGYGKFTQMRKCLYSSLLLNPQMPMEFTQTHTSVVQLNSRRRVS